MASSVHSSHVSKNHAYLYARIKNAHNVHHDACIDHPIYHVRHDAAFASHTVIASFSSSYDHGRIIHKKNFHHVISHVPKIRNESNGHYVTYRTFGASYVLYSKSGKVVASNVGPKS
jgi:hypothetical protein